MIYLQLVLQFCKTGLFSIGGGLATLPFLYEMSRTTGWFSYADIANMIAVSESTPGALGINMATYAGIVTGGIPGGIVATVGLTTPSIIIILIISRFLKKFKDNIWVERAFYGLRPASVALIAAAGINVAAIALVNSGVSFTQFGAWVNWKAVVLGAAIWYGQKKLNWHPVIFIAIAAAVGIVFQFA